MAEADRPSGQRPDLIVLVADQLRFDMLGPYHASLPDGAGALAASGTRLTPKLDILARRSTVFERHFTTCPLCLPAKGTIFTGLYPHQHGAIINGWFPHERAFGDIRRGIDLLPAVLARNGYHVIYAGVQHVRSDPPLPAQAEGIEFLGPGGPSDHHHNLAQRGLYLGDLSSFRDPVIDYDRGKPTVHTAISARTGVFPLREELYYDCVVTDELVSAIEKLGPQSQRQPVAIFAMYWLPHPPLWAPRKWAELIDPEQVKLPATVGRWYQGQPALQLANIAGQLGAHMTAEHWSKAWAMYMGMVNLLDQCVGRVLSSLDHWGMFDPALVAFTSDHGEMLGSHGLFQKFCLYDEAVRVPLLLKLPGQNTGRRCADLTDHLDLCATLSDAACIGTINHSPGRSLADQAAGRRPEHWRQQVFASYDGNAGRGFAQRMVRTRTHKLIHNVGDHPELYDLVEDPYETRNLAGVAEHRQVEQTLLAALLGWEGD